VLGVGHAFRFVGEVSWDRAPAFVNTFDVAVAPAQFANTRSGISPQKVYAYLACGRPVVGSDLEGLGDMLVREGVGLSFKAGDVNGLGDAIVRVLTDQPLADSMRQRARAVVMGHYTWEGVVRRTIEILQRVTHA